MGVAANPLHCEVVSTGAEGKRLREKYAKPSRELQHQQAVRTAQQESVQELTQQSQKVCATQGWNLWEAHKAAAAGDYNRAVRAVACTESRRRWPKQDCRTYEPVWTLGGKLPGQEASWKVPDPLIGRKGRRHACGLAHRGEQANGFCDRCLALRADSRRAPLTAGTTASGRNPEHSAQPGERAREVHPNDRAVAVLAGKKEGAQLPNPAGGGSTPSKASGTQGRKGHRSQL